jgi:hypothetical protein
MARHQLNESWDERSFMSPLTRKRKLQKHRHFASFETSTYSLISLVSLEVLKFTYCVQRGGRTPILRVS